MVKQTLSSIIDHTLLKPDATESQIITLCEEALIHQFASVCINPAYVSLAAKQLKGSNVKVCTVVGFPLGSTTTQIKVAETEESIRNGASEIDMVINIGNLKSGKFELVRDDIESVVRKAQDRAEVKVIIETCLLTQQEKELACQISKQAGAHFVKTSTGFSAGGATVSDVELMRRIVGQDVGVKASGGIKDYATALAMLHAGANRLGTSSGVKIVNEAEAEKSRA